MDRQTLTDVYRIRRELVDFEILFNMQAKNVKRGVG